MKDFFSGSQINGVIPTYKWNILTLGSIIYFLLDAAKVKVN